MGSRFTGELSQAGLDVLLFPLLLVLCVICGEAYKGWRLKKEKSSSLCVGINPEAGAPDVWEGRAGPGGSCSAEGSRAALPARERSINGP